MIMRFAKLFALAGIAALGLASAGRVLADAAPPEPPKGTSIESGYEATKVQMVSESVLMTIQDDRGVVEATFQMRNQGTATESFDVRFPIGQPDGWGEVNQVESFKAFVDGGVADVKIVDQDYMDTTIPWGTWHVTFPPGQTITLGVTYQVPPAPFFSTSFVEYLYVLETGAGWYGPIGEGVVTARLPYDVNEYNSTIRENFSPRPSYYTISGTDVIWKFDNLEPTRSDNVSLRIMRPELWRALNSAEMDVQQAPDSLDAHIALARALAAAVDEDRKHGEVYDFGTGLQIYARAIAEYEYVLQRAPDVPDFNIEYIHLFRRPVDYAKACPAFRKAVSLAPNDPRLSQGDREGLNHKWNFLEAECARFEPTTVAASFTPTPLSTVASGATDTSPTPKSSQTLPPTTSPISGSPPSDGEPFPAVDVVVGIAVVVLAITGVWLYLRAKSGAH